LLSAIGSLPLFASACKNRIASVTHARYTANLLFSGGNELYTDDAIFEASANKFEYGFRRSTRGSAFLRLPLGTLSLLCGLFR
jgi:hypothetical protein